MIKKFTVKNYKNFDEKTINIDEPLIALVGKNGAGKTSLINAMKGFMLKMPPEIIKDNCENCIFNIELDDETKIERNFGLKNCIKMNEKKTSAKSIVEYMADNFSLNSDIMKIYGSSEIFNALEGNNFMKFIIDNKIINDKMTMEKLISLVPMSPEIIKKIKTLLPEEDIDLNDISNAYKSIHKDLSLFKKEIKKIYDTLDSDIYKQFMDDETIKYNLNECKTKHSAALISLGALMEQEKKYKQSVIDFNGNEKKLILLNKYVDENKSCKKYDENIINDLLAQKNKLEKTKETACQTATSAKNTYEMSLKLYKNINTDVCPLSKKIHCTTNKSIAKKSLENILNTNKINYKNAVQTYKLSVINIENIDVQIKQYKECNELYNSIESAIQQIDILKSLKYITEAPNEQTINIAKEEVHIAKENLEIATKYSDFLRLQKDLEKYLEIIPIYKEIDTLLSVDGEINKIIIKYYTDIFQKYFVNYCKDINLKFNVKLDICDFNAYFNAHPYNMLSTGEKIKASICLSAVIQSLTGVDTLFVDNLCDLDEKSFEDVVIFLKKVNTFKTIIVSCLDLEFSNKILKENSFKIINL